MKNIVVCFVISLFVANASHAVDQKLEELSCEGLNGLTLKLSPNKIFVRTELFNRAESYQTDGKVTGYQGIWRNTTRISIGMLGLPQDYVWDIYLEGIPVTGEEQEMTGVIGKSVIGPVVFPSFPTLLPVPYGFVPVTTLTCLIRTSN